MCHALIVETNCVPDSLSVHFPVLDLPTCSPRHGVVSSLGAGGLSVNGFKSTDATIASSLRQCQHDGEPWSRGPSLAFGLNQICGARGVPMEPAEVVCSSLGVSEKQPDPSDDDPSSISCSTTHFSVKNESIGVRAFARFMIVVADLRYFIEPVKADLGHSHRFTYIRKSLRADSTPLDSPQCFI
ncbi:hypothetical protein M413DRAFT_277039 [Hebeloma cylindrosporum]|uniref:Uncharacterized protein n=1 Tax=Hebeloma cylindrosporum TaxID=76867 RepID=A0A0C3BKR4_HEBCY|nr:hypothetical protein M413DRAFT_277039 [Hebeloma cylindrosporum h7]